MKLVLLLLAIILAAALLVWIAKRRPTMSSSEASKPAQFVVEGTNEQLLADSRSAARELSAALAVTGMSLKEGMTTHEVNDLVVAQLGRRGLIPTMRGFNGYPSDSNVSVNEQVLHALPSERTLRRGDVVKIQPAPALRTHLRTRDGPS